MPVKPKHFAHASAALLCTAVLAMPAGAQQAPVVATVSSAEADGLRAEVARLRAELAALSARLEAVAPLGSPVPVAPQSAAPPPPAPATVVAVARPAAPAGPTVRLRGRLQLDVGAVSAPAAIVDRGLGTGVEFRRVYLGVDGTLTGGVAYRIEADFADNDVTLTDAYLSWTHGNLVLTAGQHKNFQSLEDTTSDLFTSFTERAAFNGAFGFERRVGLSATYSGDGWLAQGGVFADDVDALALDENNSVGADARLVISPRMGTTQLHFGASAHVRTFNDGAISTRYRARPFVHTTDTRLVDTGIFSASGERGWGLEGALIAGRLHVVGEGSWMTARRPTFADPTFFGGYAEIGYFLTNDRRGYRRGAFDRATVNSPVTADGIGAIELNLRYDYLDLIDAGVVGGTQAGYGVSLVWTPIERLALTANYIRGEIDRAAVTAAGDGSYGTDTFGLRAQIDF